jgi:hypothetical protein
MTSLGLIGDVGRHKDLKEVYATLACDVPLIPS